MSNSKRLLERVARRKRLGLHGWWVQRLTLVLAAGAAILIITTLLFDLVNPWAVRGVVALMPVAALAASFALVRRVESTDAARLIDTHLSTKDLFLTTALLDGTAGAYQPLVARRAGVLADTVPPAKVVPLPWAVPTCRTGLVMVVLLGATFVPTFDLAGYGVHDETLRRQGKKLARQKKDARQRVEALKQAPLNESRSADVTHALNKLSEAFNRMRPDAAQLNREQLKAQQAALGEKWKRTKEQLSPREHAGRMGQRFGYLLKPANEVWKRQLADGDASDLTKEMQKIRDLARELANESDPERRRALRDEIRDRLENLADLASSQASTPGLDAALEQALQQMELSAIDGLGDRAAEAFDQSMELGMMEMASLAQSLRDLAALEAAMDALTAARQLNETDPLNGESCSDCKTMADYEAIYEAMMAEQGDGAGACGVCGGGGAGSGSGMGGPGTGQGRIALEDDTVKTDYEAQRLRSPLRAGEILMSWKTHGQTPDGEARQEHAAALREVKQAYSEAILQERVPPEHHASIRRYFDTMKEEPPAQSEPEASP